MPTILNFVSPKSKKTLTDGPTATPMTPSFAKLIASVERRATPTTLSFGKLNYEVELNAMPTILSTVRQHCREVRSDTPTTLNIRRALSNVLRRVTCERDPSLPTPKTSQILRRCRSRKESQTGQRSNLEWDIQFDCAAALCPLFLALSSHGSCISSVAATHSSVAAELAPY